MLEYVILVGIGVLVAVLLFPVMKWQVSQIESEKKGFKAFLMLLASLFLSLILLYGGFFLGNFALRDRVPEEKVTLSYLYEVPSLGAFLFYLLRYIIPARLRVEKRKKAA